MKYQVGYFNREGKKLIVKETSNKEAKLIEKEIKRRGLKAFKRKRRCQTNLNFHKDRGG